MSVFISWSGENSAVVGEAFHQLLRHTLQGLKIFISSDAIRSGALWFPQIQEGLDEARFGVVVATKRALDSPWVLFESGAIWKAKSETAIAVLRVGLSVEEMRGHPLEHFHSRSTSKSDMRRLISDIGRACGLRIEDDVLGRAFESNWSEFGRVVDELPAEAATPRQRPDVDAISVVAQRLGALEQFALAQMERDKRMFDLVDRVLLTPAPQPNAFGGIASLLDGPSTPAPRRGLFGAVRTSAIADALANSIDADFQSPAELEDALPKPPPRRTRKASDTGQ